MSLRVNKQFWVKNFTAHLKRHISTSNSQEHSHNSLSQEAAENKYYPRTERQGKELLGILNISPNPLRGNQLEQCGRCLPSRMQITEMLPLCIWYSNKNLKVKSREGGRWQWLCNSWDLHWRACSDMRTELPFPTASRERAGIWIAAVLFCSLEEDPEMRILLWWICDIKKRVLREPGKE